MDWDYRITSDFSKVRDWNPEGERVAVGFRPSGELHTGNLLTLAYAAAISERLDLELDLMVCDTDWSAHIHQQHLPEESDVMRLFFERDCPCEEHDSIAEHRVEEVRPFLDGLGNALGIEVEPRFLSQELDSGYREALENVLENMEEFDSIFGGGFRRRYRSPVTTVCEDCGNSHAKGSAYSPETGELVHACRTPGCGKGFASGTLEDPVGVYYLVDPVRDPSRNVAVHVFGGDYRTAEKEQVTPKVQKVASITELATGETPVYFLTPMISDREGKPLSKSKGTGKTVSEVGDLEALGEKIASKAGHWLEEEKRHVSQVEVLD